MDRLWELNVCVLEACQHAFGMSDATMEPKGWSESSLTDALKELVDQARRAGVKSKAMHSKFRVGAAVLDADGTITCGANVESDSYGLTMCGERVALFGHVTSQVEVKPVALAVSCIDVTLFDPPNSCMPCGACRQTMSELLDKDAVVVVDQVGVFTLAELLPQAFKLISD